MPSGYTHEIYEGKDISFAEFASKCARAFGALITLRDEPLTSELPNTIEADSYHYKKVEELKLELAKLSLISIEEAEIKAESEYQDLLKHYEEKIESSKVMQSRYSDMLNKAKLWEPPTEEHRGLKDFMINQLKEGMQFDCSNGFYEKQLKQIKKVTGQQWLEDKKSSVVKDIDYHTKSHLEEVERAENRTKWIQQLKESLI